MDDEERREEAIWRATVLGPLVSARLEHGDVRRLCEEAAARVLEMLFRATHGVPRVASKLLRAGLREAHHRDQSFVDEHVIEAAIEQMGLAIVGAP